MKMTRVCLILGAVLSASLAGFAAGVTDDAFKGLSADERIGFVGSMNAMLPNFPAATEESRIETTYRLNRDFIKAAPTVDRRRVLAEVYATIPEYALPALTDGLSSKVFTRAAMGFKKDDDTFQSFALSAMLGIYRRCRSDNKLVISNQRRIAFAVVMFLKASEGIPDDLMDQLIAFVPDVVRDRAREVWIPSAMGEDGKKPTYEPMMGDSTNDVEVAKLEKPNEVVRQLLKYPSSEHQIAKVQMAKNIDNSTLLLVPELEDDYEDLVVVPEPRRKKKPTPPQPEPDPCRCPCPCPYEKQQL